MWKLVHYWVKGGVDTWHKYLCERQLEGMGFVVRNSLTSLNPNARRVTAAVQQRAPLALSPTWLNHSTCAHCPLPSRQSLLATWHWHNIDIFVLVAYYGLLQPVVMPSEAEEDDVLLSLFPKPPCNSCLKCSENSLRSIKMVLSSYLSLNKQ